MLAYNLKSSIDMDCFLKNLKWLVNAFALEPKLLHKLLPPDSYIPYEMIVDEDLSDIIPVLTTEQLEHFKHFKHFKPFKPFKPFNNYVYSILIREDLADCWYDNDFIYSLEWNAIHTMAKDFEHYMAWEISEPLPPLYSEIIYVDTDDH